ncbi:class I histocompatibility antigen, Gogo-B*0201 alpha chain-like, partial [Macrotis lagotis]|uniref:class I histocompatibility antigen, Gogo-B*0201 alpha chain-like n=1 Tax=Macrotis lagotis TaxID=92651 RepID=UPI003D689ADC
GSSTPAGPGSSWGSPGSSLLGYLDDEEFVRFDSDNLRPRAEPRTARMERMEQVDPGYWELIGRGNSGMYRVNLGTLRGYCSQRQGGAGWGDVGLDGGGRDRGRGGRVIPQSPAAPQGTSPGWGAFVGKSGHGDPELGGRGGAGHHIILRVSGREVSPGGRFQRGSAQFAYAGPDYAVLDVETSTWTAAESQAEISNARGRWRGA